MGRVVFLNPNYPEQPARGVYRWFFLKDNREVTLYVGQSGQKRKQAGSPGTLYRATSQLQASYPSYKTPKLALDADFVVGMAIRWLKSHGHVCFWQHRSNNPDTENSQAKKCKPILQDWANKDGTKIKPKFKRKSDREKWTKGQRRRAAKWLFRMFDEDQDFPKCGHIGAAPPRFV